MKTTQGFIQWVLTAFIALTTFSFSGCAEPDGPLEQAGERADEVVEETGEAAEEVREEVEEAVDEVRDN